MGIQSRERQADLDYKIRVQRRLLYLLQEVVNGSQAEKKAAVFELRDIAQDPYLAGIILKTASGNINYPDGSTVPWSIKIGQEMVELLEELRALSNESRRPNLLKMGQIELF